MSIPNDMHSWLTTPTRLAALNQAIRAKIPASDVDDVVQSTLADALTAREPPTDPETFDRWLFGIARHKVADYYRRHRRYEVIDSEIDSKVVAGSTCSEPFSDSAADLLRWVDQELPKEPETTRTLEWMMREASGDRLETIAKEHDIAAPTVRQRVSRLRRYLRERWALQVAAALGLVVVMTGLFAYRHYHDRPVIVPDIARSPTPTEQAESVRQVALEACRAGEWKPCLVGLDKAKELDPAGDAAGSIQEARAGASRALAPAPSASTVPSARSAPLPSVVPSPSDAPIPRIVPNRTTPPVTSKPPLAKKAPAPVQSKASFDKMAPAPTRLLTTKAKNSTASDAKEPPSSKAEPSSQNRSIPVGKPGPKPSNAAPAFDDSGSSPTQAKSVPQKYSGKSKGSKEVLDLESRDWPPRK